MWTETTLNVMEYELNFEVKICAAQNIVRVRWQEKMISLKSI